MKRLADKGEIGVKRRVFGRIITVMLVGFLTLGHLASVIEVKAQENIIPELDYVLGRPMTEEEIRIQEEITEIALQHNSYIAPEVDNKALRLNTRLLFMNELPERYDPRLTSVTSVKNQHPYGSCWAFSALACMEQSLIKQGLMSTSVDLSESHLLFFSSHSAPDVLGNDYLDSVSFGGTDYREDGGNNHLAMGALANWKGAVPESYAPYEDVEQEFEQTTAVAYEQNIAILKDVYLISRDDVNSIKKVIMDWGAVGASYYSSNSYINFDTAAFYCPIGMGGNHAITIVGWDDTYSKANFKEKPDADGAWLVKNSWGTDWGLDGYFWMSYEDASLNNFYAFRSGLATEYDNNYQYDFCSTVVGVSLGGTKAASVFEVKGNSGKSEQLEAVSIMLTEETNVNYSIQIYKNIQDIEDPTSGTPMLSEPQQGETTFAGYYTISLDEPVVLSRGDNFSVVFTFSDKIWVDAERSYDKMFINKASSQEGESYIYNEYWYDYGADGKGNIRIKAFTKNLEEAGVDCTSVSLSANTLDLKVGEQSILQATVLPDNATNQEVFWTSSNTDVAIVDENGKVTAVGNGEAVITVTTVDGGYTASCIITVKKAEVTPTATPKPTTEPTATPKPTVKPTATPKPTTEPTATPKPTVKPTAAPTATPKPTAAPDAGFKLPADAKKFESYQGYDFYETGDGETYCAGADKKPVINEFMCDGTDTYYFQANGTAMKDRLTYHPDGEHVIYFDENGHEVFSDFANVKKTIAGDTVDDYCFFDVYGHLYVDVVTYDKTGTYLYYANPYGVMDRGKWFEFSETAKWADGKPFDKAGGRYGYANADGTLMTNQWTYDWEGRYCYMQGNGVALYQ